jgi:hypothetical protein
MTIKKRQQQKKLESNCQTYDTSYKTKLTAYKTNRHELWSQIFNKPNVEV